MYLATRLARWLGYDLAQPQPPPRTATISLARSCHPRGASYLHLLPAPLVAHVDNLIAADAWRTTATYRSIPEELSPMSLQPTLVALPSGEDLLVVTRRYPSSRDLPLLIVSLNTDAPARPIFDADLLGVLPARPGQEAPLLLLTFTPLTLPQRTVISVARLNGEIVSSCEGTPPHLVRMAGAEWLALGASFVRIPKLDDTVPLPPRLRDARIEVAEICNNVADGAERLCVVVWTSASDEWTPCEPDEGVSRVQVWDLRSGTHLVTVSHMLNNEWDWSLCASLGVAYCANEDFTASIYSLTNGELIRHWPTCVNAAAKSDDRLWFLVGTDLAIYNKCNGKVTSESACGSSHIFGDVYFQLDDDGNRSLLHLPSGTHTSFTTIAKDLYVAQAVCVSGAFVVLLESATRHGWQVHVVDAGELCTPRLLAKGDIEPTHRPSLLPSHGQRPPLLQGSGRYYYLPLPALPAARSATLLAASV